MKRKIDFTNFLKNKEDIIGKDFYYKVGFDIIDYIVFTPLYFYCEDGPYPHVTCRGLEIKPDGINVPRDGICFKMCHLFDMIDEGVIKTLTPENYAKNLINIWGLNDCNENYHR